MRKSKALLFLGLAAMLLSCAPGQKATAGKDNISDPKLLPFNPATPGQASLIDKSGKVVAVTGKDVAGFDGAAASATAAAPSGDANAQSGAGIPYAIKIKVANFIGYPVGTIKKLSGTRSGDLGGGSHLWRGSVTFEPVPGNSMTISFVVDE